MRCMCGHTIPINTSTTTVIGDVMFIKCNKCSKEYEDSELPAKTIDNLYWGCSNGCKK